MDEKEKFAAEFQKLKDSKFKQQKLPAWRPVPTITSTTLTFIFFGIAFIVIGIIVLIYSNDIVEKVHRYDDKCDPGKVCSSKLSIDADMKLPVMVYYQLNNFYQNHRRYVKSKSNDQLKGMILTAAQIEEDCKPIVLMKDVGVKKAIDGTTTFSDTDVANPCGLIAKSFFNDKYILKDNTGDIFIDETNIAWQADKELKYAKPKDYEKIQWLNTSDEHFMVWMRPAGLPNFRKLWGRITKYNNKDILPQGTYNIEITNNYNVTAFDGEKYFVLSTVNSFGGKNSFLGIAYIVVGSLCLIMAIVFFIGYKIHNKKKEN